MFKTILVGCDGSERDRAALALARQLRAEDARVLLVTVRPDVEALAELRGDFGYAGFIRRDTEEAMARTTALWPAGLPAEPRIVVDDSTAGGLDALALNEHADLIVLGPTHRKALGRVTGRTTVQRLLHGAPCAVAVAAPGQSPGLPGHPRLAVAYDGSRESRFALDSAYAIAAETGATVRLCLALEPIVYAAGYAPLPSDVAGDEERERWAAEQLSEAGARAPEGVAVESRVAVGPAARTVLELAGSDTDLLVTGSRRYGALHRVIVGSVSTPLATNGRLPVLVTPRAPAYAEATSGGADRAAADMNGA